MKDLLHRVLRLKGIQHAWEKCMWAETSVAKPERKGPLRLSLDVRKMYFENAECNAVLSLGSSS
jgi:hypothetical protein